MRKKIVYPGFIIILFIIGFVIARMGNGDTRLFKKSRLLLGTLVEIQIKNSDKEESNNAIEHAFAEIERIDNLFSTYMETSPVWKINNSLDSIFVVDPEIFRVMILSDSVYNLSEGAFDVSLENLNNAWGFDSEVPRLPSEEEITAALNRSGWKKIKMIGGNAFSRKKGVGLNFGAIAKGYAVDQAIKMLSSLNIVNALVNAGGDIRTLGKDWIVGIQHPRNMSLTTEQTTLNNFSIASSGDYEKYFEADGERYHHIFDPSSGYPANDIMSVTVLTGECVFADALSTAVFVMGIEKGLDLLDQLENTEAMIIDIYGNKYFSSDFSNYISK